MFKGRYPDNSENKLHALKHTIVYFVIASILFESLVHVYTLTRQTRMVYVLSGTCCKGVLFKTLRKYTNQICEYVIHVKRSITTFDYSYCKVPFV